MLLLSQGVKICALVAQISFNHGLYLQIFFRVSRGELNALLKDGDLGLQEIYAFRKKESLFPCLVFISKPNMEMHF